MKKIIVLSILIVSALCVKAQCNLPYKSLEDFKNDTSAFVMYNFMDRADCYIGKTFADVIADLQMPVKTFAYRSLGINMVGIDLSIFPTIIEESEKKEFNSINIEWKEPLTRENEYPIMQGKDGWNQQMYEHYKDKKVKSIYVDIPNKGSKYYKKYKLRVDEYEKKDMTSKAFFYKGELGIQRTHKPVVKPNN